MKRTAIVLGCHGRLGRAFHARLVADGYEVSALDREDMPPIAAEGRPLLFDLAYDDGEPEQHVARVFRHLSNWRSHEAIFVPSSMWIGTDSAYGRAKLMVEQLAGFYNAIGARVVTDRIGYFPGDTRAGDPANPFYDALVTGDELYARVMARMVAEPDRQSLPASSCAIARAE